MTDMSIILNRFTFITVNTYHRKSVSSPRMKNEKEESVKEKKVTRREKHGKGTGGG